MRLLAAALALVFLFPCVSASDDLLNLEKSGNPLAGDLMRLFDSLQTFQVAAYYVLAVTLAFFVLVFSPAPSLCARAPRPSLGRAPPRYSL